MIPEFLGRLPILVTLESLTAELLVKILKDPKNAILKQYEKLLAMDEVKLSFEDAALEWIAEEALKKESSVIDRLRFLSITASNVDEFLMVRVADVQEQEASGYETPDAYGLSPKELLPLLTEKIKSFSEKQ